MKIFANKNLKMISLILLSGTSLHYATAGREERDLANSLFRFYVDKKLHLEAPEWQHFLCQLQDPLLKQKAENERKILLLLQTFEEKMQGFDQKPELLNLLTTISQAFLLDDLRKCIVDFYEKQAFALPLKSLERKETAQQEIVPKTFEVFETKREDDQNIEMLSQSLEKLELSDQAQEQGERVFVIKNAQDVDFADDKMLGFMNAKIKLQSLCDHFSKDVFHLKKSFVTLSQQLEEDVLKFKNIVKSYFLQCENFKRRLIHENVALFETIVLQMQKFAFSEYESPELEKSLNSYRKSMKKCGKEIGQLVEKWKNALSCINQEYPITGDPKEQVKIQSFFSETNLEKKYAAEYTLAMLYFIYSNFNQCLDIAQKSENFLKKNPRKLTPEDVFAFDMSDLELKAKIEKDQKGLIELIRFRENNNTISVKTESAYHEYIHNLIRLTDEVGSTVLYYTLIFDFFSVDSDPKEYKMTFKDMTEFVSQYQNMGRIFSPSFGFEKLDGYYGKIPKGICPKLSEIWNPLREKAATIWEKTPSLGRLREEALVMKKLFETIAISYDAYNDLIQKNEVSVAEKLKSLQDVEQLISRFSDSSSFLKEEIISITQINNKVTKLQEKLQKNIQKKKEKKSAQDLTKAPESEATKDIVHIDFGDELYDIERAFFEKYISEIFSGFYLMGHLTSLMQPPKISDPHLQQVTEKDFRILQSLSNVSSKEFLLKVEGLTNPVLKKSMRDCHNQFLGTSQASVKKTSLKKK